MTSPSSSSHVFYHRLNPLRIRQESTLLTRVFVTDKKVTIYNKMIVKTSKSGVLFEKIMGQQTFSVHVNRHGGTYLKRFSKSSGGSITDTSLEVAMTSRKADSRLINDVVSEEGQTLVEETILGWFGYNPTLTQIQDVHDELLFPALRDESFPRDIRMSKMLVKLQESTSLVTKALRENDSWDSFIMDLCHPTVLTLDDTAVVKKQWARLLPVAMMELPPLSVLYASDSEALLNITATFEPLDLNLIKFMFSNLSLEMRYEALQVVLGMSKIHADRYDSDSASPIPNNRSVSSEIPVQRVPVKLRPALARKLFGILRSTYAQMTRGLSTASFRDSYLCLQLRHSFRYWFAKEIMEPQLQTQKTLENVEGRFKELFEAPLGGGGSLSIKFYNANSTDFCALHRLYAKETTSHYFYDLFTSLRAMVTKNQPKDKGAGGGYAMLNGYVRDDNMFVPEASGLYSLDDLMTIIELGVAATDEQLTKLGREITPANRVAFLTFGSKERKFKNTWKYYDYGVTDLTKMLALKASKVTKKEDIQTYNALPDEMFYEFVAMASGKELSTTEK